MQIEIDDWIKEPERMSGERCIETCRIINMPWHELATAWPVLFVRIGSFAEMFQCAQHDNFQHFNICIFKHADFVDFPRDQIENWKMNARDEKH